MQSSNAGGSSSSTTLELDIRTGLAPERIIFIPNVCGPYTVVSLGAVSFSFPRVNNVPRSFMDRL